ncbi:MAG: hypothetical protein A2Y62_03920 [Candidatus Fischerbacteria bacterium RBG_13_37_8]|uniref:Uncharacterized protein n=1 Tax=Candidatus Fischerbacteria bacterium RBG_13_37_8 TaxID=1817863 RepID=A0A1F5V5G8_9BACT|nr:MAG: hypothetical protein A2Y62_03920 [Candidatus Fischerbacteria bacterium RBG_13_37_8]
MVNAGKLEKCGEKWKAWFGAYYDISEVIVAMHKNEIQSAGWQIYSTEQIETAIELCSLLVQHYYNDDMDLKNVKVFILDNYSHSSLILL